MRRKGTDEPRMAGWRNYVSGAALGALLAVLPLLAVSSGTTAGVSGVRVARAGASSVADRAMPSKELPTVATTGLAGVVGVDGSLPEPPQLRTLFVRQVPNGPLGVPQAAMDAYRQAAQMLSEEQPGCHIDWALIASIGRIESNHARGGYVDAAGTTREPILGPVLDGTGDVAAIPDTDGGTFDGDTRWDRAVGPMQFIPSTWRHYGANANGDGVSDPNNIYDAALATARYLCAGGVDLAETDQLRAAVLGYNHSAAYVNEVLVWAESYRTGAKPVPNSDVPLGAPTPVHARPAAEPVALPPQGAGPSGEDESPGGAGTASRTSPPGSSGSDTSARSTQSTSGSTTGPTTTTTEPTTTTTTTTTTSPTETTSSSPSCTTDDDPSSPSSTSSTPTSSSPTSSPTTTEESPDPCVDETPTE